MPDHFTTEFATHPENKYGMRTFINIVTENEGADGIIGPYDKSGPLYHGTSPYGLGHILAEKMLDMGGDDAWGAEPGVSLTTDFNTAKFFAERGNEPHLFDSDLPVIEIVLEFDADELRAAFGDRVVFYADPDLGSTDWEDEKEVRVLDEVPASMIRRIHVSDPEGLKAWVKEHKLKAIAKAGSMMVTI
jgi:hypothetical protein